MLEIAVDVGGTFTDFVVREADGSIGSYKSSTTPSDISGGIFDGLDLIASRRGVDRRELLAHCAAFAYGTTVATNAILERKVACTGLICTEGFRDTLLIREGGKADTYNLRVDYPPPYIPRHLTVPVRERVTAEGTIAVPLDDADALAAIARLREADVDAVAVALLWSIANPAHEVRIGALLAEQMPSVPVSLSHLVHPSLREYRRTSATAIDASLKPIVQRAVGAVEKRLREAGFAGVLTLVTSNGGRTAVADVLEKPVYLCLSGPSAAPQAATSVARQDGIPGGNLLTIDMGGTSFDVSISTAWETAMHREGVIGGHMFGVPSVDVRTIGAGGGSIARVDVGRMLNVGPASAGAFPGPACYGRGGALATVTDANLVRGLLDPDDFADGQMRLSPETAEAAIRTHVAEPLGVDVAKAASLIAVAVEQNMVAAIEAITIRRGVDPRGYTFVCGGSAAGLHAAAMARELGVRRVLVPGVAGVLSAYGIATGDVRFNFSRSFFASSARFDHRGVDAVLAVLEREGVAYLDRMRVASARRVLAFSAEARYAGQVWQLTLPLSVARIQDAAALAQVVERFHALHEQTYSVRAEDPVEFAEWNLVAIGLAEQPPAAEAVTAPHGTALPQRYRRAWLREAGGAVELPVFMAERTASGLCITGPALVQSRLRLAGPGRGRGVADAPR